MHGRFTSNLREFAHDYAIKLKYQIEEEQQREKDEDDFRSLSGTTFSWQLKCKPPFISKIEIEALKLCVRICPWQYHHFLEYHYQVVQFVCFQI